jgi:mRNA interferase MazF
MATSSDYRLGSIWLVTFDPSVGTEIQKTRPAVIISGTAFNQRSKITVLPITSVVPNPKALPVMVAVPASDINGLNTNSYIVCIDPMTFDKKRCVKRLGQLEPEQMQHVQRILTAYLELQSIE